MKRLKLLTTILCLIPVLVMPVAIQAQHDPGPRPGPAGAGGPFSTLNATEQALFNEAFMRLQEVQSVSGKIDGEDSGGLGPTFNGNSCTMCHAQPALGGTSPGLTSPQNAVPNPQVALATLDGAANFVPSFISANSPVREARFVRNPDGSLDGGVHGLFTIAGRSDAPGCTLGQPNFAQQLLRGNVVFRIPTPIFGLGLVENTPDTTLRDNLAANHFIKSQLGIGGRFNTSGNDGTITRFGWKAQNKSLLIFAGEAYNVEQGVANEVFPNERAAVPGCVFNPTPEDASGVNTEESDSPLSDTLNFAIFMRLAAPPVPASLSSSAQNGSTLFNAIGCALCHSGSLTTADSIFTGMGGVAYHPFSDFALHHMGSGLADGINQGAAGPDEFRTAPLWGVGQRLFFLHDGRTSDLMEAIESHADCNGRDHVHDRFHHCNSEANAVVRNFNSLNKTQMQDILNFLRSL